MKWRWGNIPIPEAHLAGLIAGSVMRVIMPIRLFRLPLIGYAAGIPILIFGIGICIWAVFEARSTAISAPDALLTAGPYAFSRNPMYVGWTLLYIGVSLVTNSLWTAAVLPIVVVFTHFMEIRKEERFLRDRFGDEYAGYRKRVRRYF